MSSVVDGKCKYCGRDSSMPNFAYHFCRGYWLPEQRPTKDALDLPSAVVNHCNPVNGVHAAFCTGHESANQ
jgi:hypothetical protein